jgi:hypothetical protein
MKPLANWKKTPCYTVKWKHPKIHERFCCSLEKWELWDGLPSYALGFPVSPLGSSGKITRSNRSQGWPRILRWDQDPLLGCTVAWAFTNSDTARLHIGLTTVSSLGCSGMWVPGHHMSIFCFPHCWRNEVILSLFLRQNLLRCPLECSMVTHTWLWISRHSHTHLSNLTVLGHIWVQSASQLWGDRSLLRPSSSSKTVSLTCYKSLSLSQPP